MQARPQMGSAGRSFCWSCRHQRFLSRGRRPRCKSSTEPPCPSCWTDCRRNRARTATLSAGGECSAPCGGPQCCSNVCCWCRRLPLSRTRLPGASSGGFYLCCWVASGPYSTMRLYCLLALGSRISPRTPSC